jgi:hypothetical protein
MICAPQVSKCVPRSSPGVVSSVLSSLCPLPSRLGGWFAEVKLTRPQLRRKEREERPGSSAGRSGKGEEESGEGRRIWSGAVQEASKDMGYSCAPAGPRGGNEGGCSTLAVVSTGLVKCTDTQVWSTPIANCGNGARPVNRRSSSRTTSHGKASSRRPPLINSVCDRARFESTQCCRGQHTSCPRAEATTRNLRPARGVS